MESEAIRESGSGRYWIADLGKALAPCSVLPASPSHFDKSKALPEIQSWIRIGVIAQTQQREIEVSD